jgi:transcriptional regulator with XRE-family HTH domain
MALAHELGVTFQQVQKYEKGVNRVGAGRLTKIASVLKIPVGKLLEVDEEQAGRHNAPPEATSPLGLITLPGALRLLRAYANLKDGILRRSIVALVEDIACRPVGKSKSTEGESETKLASERSDQ